MKQRLIGDPVSEVVPVGPASAMRCLACGSVCVRDECPTCELRVEVGRLRALVASYQKTVNHLEFKAGG